MRTGSGKLCVSTICNYFDTSLSGRWFDVRFSLENREKNRKIVRKNCENRKFFENFEVIAKFWEKIRTKNLRKKEDSHT